jgi:ankyrin repeat protein
MIAEQTAERDLSALARVSREFHAILVDHLYQINIRRHDGAGICKAAIFGSLPAVKRFMTMGIDVRQGYAPTSTSRYNEFLGGNLEHPLLHATQYGHVELVQYLLEEGSDPDVRAGNRLTPLLIASRTGSLSIVKALKEAGGDGRLHAVGDPNFLEMFQRTPIREAAYGGHLNVVKYLFSVSETGDTRSLASECFPEAAASGNMELVIYLLEKGSDVNYRGWVFEGPHARDWGSALSFAVKYNHPDMVRLLLKNNARIESAIGSGTARVGTTLFRLAVRLGFGEVLKVLLDHDFPEEHVPDLDDLLHCAIFNGQTTIVEGLLTRLHDDTGTLYFAMEDAINFGHTDIVELLLKKGFNTDEAMLMAVVDGRKKIVECLLRRGIDPNSPTAPRSPLRLALNTGNIPMTELLLHYGAHINPLELQRFRRAKEKRAFMSQFSPTPS